MCHPYLSHSLRGLQSGEFLILCLLAPISFLQKWLLFMACHHCCAVFSNVNLISGGAIENQASHCANNSAVLQHEPGHEHCRRQYFSLDIMCRCIHALVAAVSLSPWSSKAYRNKSSSLVISVGTGTMRLKMLQVSVLLSRDFCHVTALMYS